jgi:tRNA uridine 5-carboxymethylaminomethyl modification enzyme
VQKHLSGVGGLDVLEGEVDDVVLDEEGRCKGVRLRGGLEIGAGAVVVTTGTFLGGVLMCGGERYAGGRHLRDSEEVEPPSNGLSETLREFGFELGRLKTGTPPRIDGRTIDYGKCKVQASEEDPKGFGHVRQFRGDPMPHQGSFVDCHQTRTTEETHRVCLDNEGSLPGGYEDGVGPR